MHRIILMFLVCSLSVCGICAITAGALSPGMEYENLTEEDMTAVMERMDLSLIQSDSKKIAIQCFDVSQDGTIALGMGSGSGSMIYVYDPLGEFQYGYRFSSDGDYGVVFQGDYLAIFFIRGNEAVVFDSSGKCVAVQKLLNTSQNYAQIKELLNRTVKESAGNTYVLERDFGIGDSFSRLVAVDAHGERAVLYDVTPQHATGQIVFVAGILCFFVIVVVGCIKKTRKKHGS